MLLPALARPSFSLAARSVSSTFDINFAQPTRKIKYFPSLSGADDDDDNKSEYAAHFIPARIREGGNQSCAALLSHFRARTEREMLFGLRRTRADTIFRCKLSRADGLRRGNRSADAESAVRTKTVHRRKKEKCRQRLGA
jgi:hypothetical protein